MDLYINTSDKKIVRIRLKEGRRILAENEFMAEYKQAEKLLPAIEQLLRNIKANIKNIKRVYVVDKGDSFTALRIGVVIANALAFALRGKVLPFNDKGKNKEKKFNIVRPIYHKEPNITV